MKTIDTPSIWIKKESGRKIKVYKVLENGVVMYDGLGKNDGVWGGASPTIENFMKHHILLSTNNKQLDLFEVLT